MQGYIITYDSKKTTEINHKLFGKVTNVKCGSSTKNYYYPGVFETALFCRLSKGCIFAEKDPGTLEGMLQVREAEVEIESGEMMTAHDFWKKRFGDEEVKNLK